MTAPTLAEAAAKAEEKAKKTDYYADLTDEERAEEGLPAKETPKADPGPEPEPEPEPEPAEDDAATERLFEEIAGLREDLSASLGKPEPAPSAKRTDEDPLLAAALEHEDPVVRGLAERLQEAEKRLGATETDARYERVGRQLAKDDADFDAVRSSYAVGGKPMSGAHVEMIEDYILANPEIGSRLSIEEITRVVFPDAVKLPRPAAAKGPGGSVNGKAGAVATIVDEGNPGGATAGAWKPRTNESIESAVEAAAKRFGWKR